MREFVFVPSIGILGVADLQQNRLQSAIMMAIENSGDWKLKVETPLVFHWPWFRLEEHIDFREIAKGKTAASDEASLCCSVLK